MTLYATVVRYAGKLIQKKVELSHRFYLKINLTLKSNFIKITLRYGCSPVSTSLKSGD